MDNNSNVYKHDVQIMRIEETKINNLIKEYNNKLLSIEKLINEIYTSNSWYDVELKEEFNNTCNSYVKILDDNLNNMNILMEKLKIKIDLIEEFENLNN